MKRIKNVGKKVFIEGVRKVSWDTGEMCEFASSLVSAMQSLGEDIPYPYVMGTSGVAFRFTLSPGEWDFGNYGIRNISTDPNEPIRRAIEASGYSYTLREKGSAQEDTATVMASIDQGIPVLAYGVVGPSDTVIITGYDEDGQALLGWSTYQDIPDDHKEPHDETGYFRKHGWHANLHGYILLGEKQPQRARQSIYLEAFRWAVYLMTDQKLENRCTGLEGLKVWAEEMTQEKYFPPGNDETLGQRYVSTAINMTMLRDHCTAEQFLRQAIMEVPEFYPELSLVAECYAEVSRIRSEMDDIIGDNFSEPAMKAINYPDTRREYAGKILEIREKESVAIAHLQHLLERYR